MLSETLKIDNVNDWRGVMHYPEGSAYQHNRSPNSAVPDELRASMCTTTLPRAPCTGVGANYDKRILIFSARSLHPGGVNVAMADGSVRFVSNSVNLTTWQNLGVIADGNVLGEF
jgi:prepilin-type processing-associated H-X9-DG protein